MRSEPIKICGLEVFMSCDEKGVPNGGSFRLNAGRFDFVVEMSLDEEKQGISTEVFMWLAFGGEVLLWKSDPFLTRGCDQQAFITAAKAALGRMTGYAAEGRESIISDLDEMSVEVSMLLKGQE